MFEPKIRKQIARYLGIQEGDLTVTHLENVLGVECVEDFRLKGYRNECMYYFFVCPYRGLVKSYREPSGMLQHIIANRLLPSILSGKYKVSKVTANPKYGKKYYTIDPKYLVVLKKSWSGDSQDFLCARFGLMFKTEEEAEHALTRLYSKGTGNILWQQLFDNMTI